MSVVQLLAHATNIEGRGEGLADIKCVDSFCLLFLGAVKAICSHHSSHGGETAGCNGEMECLASGEPESQGALGWCQDC